MSNRLVARRYANALRDLAVGAKSLDRVDSDVSIVADTVSESDDLAALFASPVVSREKKKSVVKALFGSRVGESVLNFVLLLIDKGREQSIKEITTAYRELRDEQEGVVEATARTAEPMSAEEKKRLQTALEEKTGKHVRLNVQQDAAIIGGLIVRIGDVVYDGSVRNSLAQLREQFGLGSISQN